MFSLLWGLRSQEQCQLVVLSVELPSPLWLRPVLALALALNLVLVQKLHLLHHYRSHQQLSYHQLSLCPQQSRHIYFSSISCIHFKHFTFRNLLFRPAVGPSARLESFSEQVSRRNYLEIRDDYRCASISSPSATLKTFSSSFYRLPL
jgi:hypothetical protein